jgi:glycosyltransferase involved in cell wall biosynthesis
MKVVHVLPNAGSGIESLVCSMTPHLSHWGVETHLIYLSSSVAPLQLPPDVVASVTVLPLRLEPARSLRRFRRLMRGLRPDVIHSHSFLPTVVSSLASIPARHVRTVHTPYPYFFESNPRSIVKRLVEIRALRVVDSQLVCVSNAVARSLPWAPPRVFRTIYNGVPADSLTRPRGTPDSRKIVAVGRLEEQKGYPRLLAAFSILLSDLPDAQLLIAGEGTQHLQLAGIIKSLQIGQSVRLLGHVTDVASLYRDARLCASSSNYEGFGLSIVEALCSGCQVVSTPIDSAREIAAVVRNGVRFAEDFRPESLAKAMKAELLQSTIHEDVRRLRLAQAARDAFSVQKCAASYFQLYKDIRAPVPPVAKQTTATRPGQCTR